MSRKNKSDSGDYWRIPTDYSKVDPLVAERLGINEAVVLRTIYNLSRWKKLNDGVEWFQGSTNFWLMKFRWLSQSTFKRIIAKLAIDNLIEVRVDREGGNHYRPVQETIVKLLDEEPIESPDYEASSVQNEPTGQVNLNPPSGQFEPTRQVNLNRPSVQNEPTLLTLESPYTIPYTIPYTSPSVAEASASAPPTKPKKEKSSPNGSLVFEAYREAYVRRYEIEPLRNAKTNAVCSQIAKQLPLDEAKALMHFYLKQNVSWYVQKSHAIEYALKDVQALRTNMMRNRTMSTTAAQQADRLAAQKQAMENFHGKNTEIDASTVFGGDLCESHDHRAPLKLLRPKT